ncbi:MAG: leucine--tRNA ligase [Chitinophagaceae bacterium]|nr:MAG: leucine--tRNA ligase [Chitinophagaceae bacterium]
MDYNYRNIEAKWQQHWRDTNAYRAQNPAKGEQARPKFYVLDMFPYPSGAGLHVGHPLGYIASDIFSRYKRTRGFNVLHPMGYDAFGLPAEQYAIEHGVHPAVSTAKNIDNFRRQLDKIGFSFDWDRQVNTSEPQYYRWTQWVFLQLFKSFYNRTRSKAEPIETLVSIFEKEGNAAHPCPGDSAIQFTAQQWKTCTEQEQQDILMHYRLAFCGYGEVNWCEALGTVLANDEVVNGVSERGGYPVVKKKLRQWYLRITEYADRLLTGLETVEFSDAMKEMQTNWIGKSYGAEIDFEIQGLAGQFLKVYTTRPDTIFGVDFMVIAPEHEMVDLLTMPEQLEAVQQYIDYVKSRSERERMAEKKISGCFTGAYVLNPFNNQPIPVWISEYVLAGYGTGAIMAVPCGDERDHKFAQYFDIPVTNIIGEEYNGLEANPTKDAILHNSYFLDGLVMRDAISVVLEKLEEKKIGTRKVNYRMRDAAFSRQRYWGEPFPVKWINGIAYPLDESDLPLELPKVDTYSAGPEGEGPLANIESWTAQQLETNTMPGYAGSSWYFLRYMDPHNNEAFCSREASDYWGQVDIYIGGTEHAVGHLLYSRLWTKFLFDRGYIGHDEPFRKLVNQGMIQGSSRFIYRLNIIGEDGSPVLNKEVYVSKGIADGWSAETVSREELAELVNEAGLTISPISETAVVTISPIHVDVNAVDGIELNIAAVRRTRQNYEDAVFVTENGKYYCGAEVEKMSKSKFNTVNPDDLVTRYGADTFRMYEMFLGPVEMSKPWDTKGIEGVHRFLKKLWRLFYDETKGQVWSDEKPSPAELKVLHKTIKKIEDDTERFSFNTAVSAFMVCVNELTELKCHKKQVLEPLLVLLTPYAPHITEELWSLLGNSNIPDAAFPEFEARLVAESAKEYPVSINGKVRTNINISLEASQQDVENIVLQNDIVLKWLDGKPHKKIIYVKNKMINVVV